MLEGEVLTFVRLGDFGRMLGSGQAGRREAACSPGTAAGARAPSGPSQAFTGSRLPA